MQSWQVCAAILAALLLSGCAELSLGGDPVHPVTGGLEIWNRTEEPLVLTGSNIFNSMPPDSPRLEVGPCEHVVVPSFPQNTIEFRSAHGGYIATMGNAGMPGGASPRPLYIVFTAEAAGIETPSEPPTELPPCEGRPQVQEGV
jgi:hypothetical protein